MTDINRRSFISMAAGMGAMAFAPGCASSICGIASGRSPNGRLQIGVIGCGGLARDCDIPGLARNRRVDMVAFCDVDLAALASLRVKYPKARFYQHWREMLDREQLDAVGVATPDHNHCLIMSEVMRRGLHLYAQKPLCRTFCECRQLEQLAASSGVVTQLGAQITPWECDRYTAALLQRGVIGKIEKVWIYSSTGYYAKMLPRKLNLPEMPVPSTLDWDAWLEGAPKKRAYNKAYTPFSWRAFRDFGSGWLGDMGTHLMLPIWFGMKLGKQLPRTAKAEVCDIGWSKAMLEEYLPLYTHVTWKFDGVEASDMKPFEVEWCDGPRGGEVPKEFLPENMTEKIGGNQISMNVPANFLPPKDFETLGRESVLGELPIQGRVVKGSDGWLISTHYNKPPVTLDKNGKRRPLDLPFVSPQPDHWHDFVDCCLDGGTTTTDLSWTVKLTDWLLLGRAAIDNPGKEIPMIG